MSVEFLLKRGLKADLPASAPAGEPLLTTDTHELYAGTGTGIALIAPASGVYDIAIYVPGMFADGQTCFELNSVRTFVLPIHLTGSVAKLDVAPTAEATFTIFKNSTEIGTIAFAAGTTTGVLVMAAQQEFDATTDMLKLVAPTTSDVTASGLSVTFRGTRI